MPKNEVTKKRSEDVLDTFTPQELDRLQRRSLMKDDQIVKLQRELDTINSSHRHIEQELRSQLTEKSNEVAQLSRLFTQADKRSREAEKQLESQLRRERQLMRTLQSQPKKKETSAHEKVLQQTVDELRQHVKDRTGEIEHLETLVARKEHILLELQKNADTQIAQKDEQIKVLQREVEKRDKFADQREELIALRQQFVAKEASTKELVKDLSSLKKINAQYNAQIQQKQTEIEKIRSQLKDSKTKGVVSETRSLSAEFDTLSKQLEQRDQEIARLNKLGLTDQQAYDATIRQMDEQMKSRLSEIDRLTQLVNTRDKMLQDLTHSFETQLNEKDKLVEKIKSQLTKRAIPTAHQEQEIHRLEEEIALKEASTKSLLEDFASVKKLNTTLTKELKESVEKIEALEAQYGELLNTTRVSREKHIKDVTENYARRELQHRNELEKMRIKIATQESILKEKQQAIDDMLTQFSTVTKQLLGMRGSEAPVFKQPAVSQDEERLAKELKEEAEELMLQAKQREETVQRQEQLLHKEQETLQGEIEVLKQAGMELRRTKDYLKDKLSEVPDSIEKRVEPKEPEPVEEPAPELPEPPVMEAPIATPAIEPPSEEPKQVEALPLPKAEDIMSPPPPPKITSLPQSAHPADEPSVFGPYSEENEIHHMVNVALQHGEEPKHIKHSLLQSGYAEKVIDKILKKIK